MAVLIILLQEINKLLKINSISIMLTGGGRFNHSVIETPLFMIPKTGQEEMEWLLIVAWF